MEQITIKASDGLLLAVAVFDVENAKAAVQIIHGLKEHKERYFPLIRFLNDHGYAVIISDNRGHGESVSDAWPLGYMEGIDGIIADQILVTEYMKKRYPDLPFYLFGHSFGSMVARVYLQENDDQIDKLLLSGTVNYIPIARFGNLVGNVLSMFSGKRGYNRWMIQIGDNGENDWVVKNPEALRAYREDPLCTGYKYMNRAIMTIWEADAELKRFAKYECKNPTLPVFSISGVEDPVTGGTRGLADTIQTLKKIGYQNVESKVYDGMKHEVINEEGKEQVYQDILAFFEK